MVSDQESAARSLAGDRSAFDAIVLRHQDALFRHLLALGADRELAEDLCQEAFVRLYRVLARFDQRRPIAPFLFKIATNLWRKARKRGLVNVRSGELDTQLRDPEVPVAQQAVEQLELEAIRAAMTQLRWEYRAVISLRYDLDLSYREIAEAPRVPVGTVAAWLHRAVDEVRAALEDERGRR
jgi:RNA polymerase sigma-70 factor (ECF subfamily)